MKWNKTLPVSSVETNELLSISLDDVLYFKYYENKIQVHTKDEYYLFLLGNNLNQVLIGLENSGYYFYKTDRSYAPDLKKVKKLENSFLVCRGYFENVPNSNSKFFEIANSKYKTVKEIIENIKED